MFFLIKWSAQTQKCSSRLVLCDVLEHARKELGKPEPFGFFYICLPPEQSDLPKDEILTLRA